MGSSLGLNHELTKFFAEAGFAVAGSVGSGGVRNRIDPDQGRERDSIGKPEGGNAELVADDDTG